VPISNKYVTKSMIFPGRCRRSGFQKEDVTAANPAEEVALSRFDLTMTAERLIKRLRDQQSLSGLGSCAECGTQQGPRLNQGRLKRCPVRPERGGA
jgi:hypothetical protein